MTRQPIKEWSNEEIFKLKMMRANGTKWDDIADALGRTKWSCKSKWGCLHYDSAKYRERSEFKKPDADAEPTPEYIDPRPIIANALAVQRGFRIPPDKERYLSELLKTGMPVRQAYKQVGGVPV